MAAVIFVTMIRAESPSYLFVRVRILVGFIHVLTFNIIDGHVDSWERPRSSQYTLGMKSPTTKKWIVQSAKRLVLKLFIKTACHKIAVGI